MFGSRKGIPAPVETDCIDLGSPYDAVHVGKLPHIEESDAPPANHCVIKLTDGSYNVLRFTPLNSVGPRVTYGLANQSINPGNGTSYFESAEQAAATHLKHLQYLGEIGLNPWFNNVQAGTSRAFNDAPGVFVRQSLLPGHTVYPSLLPDQGLWLSLWSGHSIPFNDCKKWQGRQQAMDIIKDRHIQYLDWVVRQEEPVALADIASTNQYSILPALAANPYATLILHDIELRYTSADQAQDTLNALRTIDHS